MPEKMSISVNGQSQVPPGFRFHPTEEELLQYYLRKKVSYEQIDLDVIRDVDLNRLEPWDIQEKCKIGSTPQNDWYFFSHKDKKYPTGTRTNRATSAGFWKATGRDKVIYSNTRRIGMRKTLVFYRGRAPHGQKSDWIMHEYRLLDDNMATDHANIDIVCDAAGEATQEEGWVVCRIFKKKNHHKSNPLVDSPIKISAMNYDNNVAETRSQVLYSSDHDQEGTLEQMLQYVHEGSACKKEGTEAGGMIMSTSTTGYLLPPILVDEITTNSYTAVMKNGLHDRFMIKLPSLLDQSRNNYYSMMISDQLAPSNHHQIQGHAVNMDNSLNYDGESGERSLSDWTADLDRLVASQLTNGQTHDDTDQMYSLSKQLPASSSHFTDLSPTRLI